MLSQTLALIEIIGENVLILALLLLFHTPENATATLTWVERYSKWSIVKGGYKC